MAPHNKRERARQAQQKERRAAAHHRPAHYPGNAAADDVGVVAGAAAAAPPHSHHTHHRHGARGAGASYLSGRTNRRMNGVTRVTPVAAGASSAQHNNNSNSANASAAHTHAHTYDGPDPLDQQIFDYLIVIDVEATCEKNDDAFEHEIIELPAVLIDVRRGVVDRARSFRTFVRPVRHPQLTRFCTELTGITQADVDAAPTIDEALGMLMTWYTQTIARGAVAAFAADGPWDFRKFLHECHVQRDGVACPTLLFEYIDIRTTFATVFHRGVPLKLEPMLHALGLRFEGRPHCGFDDAYNIARLALAMMRAGCVFDFLVALPLSPHTPHYHVDGYPLYRRREGSGRVDRDVVHDIAKRCYGAAFFAFGEAHRRATLTHRAAAAAHATAAGEASAAVHMRRAVRREREARQRRARRRRLSWLLVLCAVALLVCAVVLWALPTLLMTWRMQRRHVVSRTASDAAAAAA